MIIFPKKIDTIIIVQALEKKVEICYNIIRVKIKEDKLMAKKKKRDIGKIAIRVIAAVLALMFVVSMAGTLIYYLAA